MKRVSKPLRRSIWAFWNFLGKRAARAYIAGPELNDAMRVCHSLSQDGFNSTIGFWNSEEDPAQMVADCYFDGLEASNKENMDCYISIKLPALEYSRQLLSEVLQKGKQYGIRVHFDSLGPETVDQTLSLITELLPTYGAIGCTLPSRWRRSLHDVEWVIEHGLIVRVIKGQWVDPDAPNIDMRAGYLRIIQSLAGRARHVSVATHDTPLAEKAIKILREADTPCDMELLYGLPSRKSIVLAQRLGMSVRFYIPYGTAWLPYCLSWAKRNPGVFWWILRDLVTSGLEHSMGHVEKPQ
jgi:proline dehydrogenase